MRVRIADIHRKDAFYNDPLLLGAVGEFTTCNYRLHEYISGSFIKDQGKEMYYFLAVKVEPIIEEAEDGRSL